MSKLYVKPYALSDAAQRLKRVQQKANGASVQTQAILRALPEGVVNAAVEARLRRAYEKILDTAVRLGSMNECLLYVMEAYTACEKRLCDLRYAPQDAAAGSLRKRFKAWWNDLLITLGLRKEPDGGTETEEPSERPAVVENPTRSQEKLMDEYLQKEVFKLLGDKKYSKEAWAAASVGERKALLNSYMEEIAEIMGVKLDGDIDFFNKPSKNGIITNGSYSTRDNTISLNTYILEKSSPASSYKMFSTLIHEMRHAYQHAAVNNPGQFQVSAETLTSWENNFNNYVSSGSGGYDAYRAQPIEADARAFARQS